LFAVIGGIFMIQIIILADHIVQTLLSTRSNHV
jgi:hypothetical protein